MSILEHESDLDAGEPVEVQCTNTDLIVELRDGRVIRTPLWWYPRLLNATAAQRSHYELSPFGVHWPELDEDLSVAGMLGGRKAPGALLS